MKTALLLALCFASFAAQAADPVVVVTSASSVTVDGADFGKPADAIANNPALAPAIQRALEVWAQKLVTAKADAEAALATTNARITAVLGAKLNDELATGDGPRAALLRELQVVAAKSDVDLKVEALDAEIAAKQKERDALTK